jgi:Xaa-Pro aminopeptidase
MASRSVVAFLIAALVFSLGAPVAAVEKAPLAEYQSRRAHLAEQIQGSVLILEAATETELTEYYQEHNFYYLTGFDDPDATFVLDATKTPAEEFLFLPPRNPAEERWTGVKLGPGADAERATGIRKVLPRSELERVLNGFRSESKPILRLDDAKAKIAALRQVKSASEIALLEKAIDATMKGLDAASRTVAPGVMEYQVEAELEREFRWNGAERPGFPSIVGSGPLSTTLHYNRNDRRMMANELVVVDVGAEYSGYSADITRTFPVSGKFSSRQREIYQIVLDAQKAAMALVKPGVRINQIHSAAYNLIRSKGYAQYFPHGTSHHIGLEVHDVGDTSRPLEPGMVITVEPGIYIDQEQLGVRIEDDVLVTNDGYRLLSTFPREIREIEELMAASRRNPRQ